MSLGKRNEPYALKIFLNVSFVAFKLTRLRLSTITISNSMLGLRLIKLSRALIACNKAKRMLFLIAIQYQLHASIVGYSFDLQNRVSSTNEKWNALFASANSNLETLKRASDITNSTHSILTAFLVKFAILDSSGHTS